MNRYRYILQNIDGEGQNYLDLRWSSSPEEAMHRARENWNEAQATDLKLLKFVEYVPDSWWVATDDEMITSAIVFLDGAIEE